MIVLDDSKLSEFLSTTTKEERLRRKEAIIAKAKKLDKYKEGRIDMLEKFADVEFLSIQDIADYFSVSRQSIDKLVKAGSIPSFRVGRKIKVKKVDVENYINYQINK
jgi:excisionase family DNA binding protein